MKTNKLLRIVGVLTIVFIILAFVGKRVGWFGKAETIQVMVEQGQLRTIVETISANGRINPETEVKISPDVSGEIVELHVKEGQFVKAGTLLAKIKPDNYMSAKDRALAALNSSKARVSQVEASYMQAELSYNRSKQLWEQKTISRSDFEQAEATYKMAQADVASAKAAVKSSEASLREANENLIRTTLYAPIDGTIYGLRVEKGERVVGTAMMSGTEMMRVADLGRMEVVVEVNENDIVRVKMGDTAIVEVDAYLDYEFKGIVTEMANSATTTGVSVDQVTSFNVKILLLEESYRSLLNESNSIPFRPGMSATVDIQTKSVVDVLCVPIQAVTTRSDTLDAPTTEFIEEADEDLKVVLFVAVDEIGISLQKEVETGIQDNNYIEIKSGLTLEDKVIIAPYSAISKKLADSSLIEIVSREELFKGDG